MVFNSLGSNYDIKFALKTLFATNNHKNRTDVLTFLSAKYGGRTLLVYKGREAIKLALDLSGLPKGSKVGVTVFTCSVVFQAVIDAGYVPELMDIDSTLNFPYSELIKHPNLKALIVQNTLGIPCEIEKIKKYCVEKNIILIEDLAHSAGLKYNNGSEMGTAGDFAALSFSQDKMVDAVSGGALIIRNKKFQYPDDHSFKSITLVQQLKDRFYPVFTWKIRKTYAWGLGKGLHFILRRFKVLSQPISGDAHVIIHNLPDWYCAQIKDQFSRLDADLKHRRKISAIYAANINPKIITDKSACLRFPILVANRQELISYLKTSGIYVSDIWYDTPILKQILNLPTHRQVSLKVAKDISKKINLWLNTRH